MCPLTLPVQSSAALKALKKHLVVIRADLAKSRWQQEVVVSHQPDGMQPSQQAWCLLLMGYPHYPLTICTTLGSLSSHHSLQKSFFFTVFFLLLSVILPSKAGIGRMATAWLERQSTADGGTKAGKQFSFISSQVQLLVLPDC